MTDVQKQEVRAKMETLPCLIEFAYFTNLTKYFWTDCMPLAEIHIYQTNKNDFILFFYWVNNKQTGEQHTGGHDDSVWSIKRFSGRREETKSTF